MSDYHQDEPPGFGTTAPPNVFSEWFFKALFFPPIKRISARIHWTKVTMKSYFKGKWYSKISSFFYWLFVKIIEKKAKRIYTPSLQARLQRVEAKI